MRSKSPSSILLTTLLMAVSAMLTACTASMPVVKWTAQPELYNHNWEATPTLSPDQGVVQPVTTSAVVSPSISVTERLVQATSDAHSPGVIEYSYPKPDLHLRSLKTEWGLVIGRCNVIFANPAWMHQAATRFQWLAITVNLSNTSVSLASNVAPDCLPQVLGAAAQAGLKVAIQVSAPDTAEESQAALARLRQACGYLVGLLRDHPEIQAVQVSWPVGMRINHYAISLSSFYGAIKRVAPTVWVIAGPADVFDAVTQFSAVSMLTTVSDYADCYGFGYTDVRQIQKAASIFKDKVICGIFRQPTQDAKRSVGGSVLGVPVIFVVGLQPGQPAGQRSVNINVA